jgi:hypothetical protein
MKVNMSESFSSLRASKSPNVKPNSTAKFVSQELPSSMQSPIFVSTARPVSSINQKPLPQYAIYLQYPLITRLSEQLPPLITVAERKDFTMSLFVARNIQDESRGTIRKVKTSAVNRMQWSDVR